MNCPYCQKEQPETNPSSTCVHCGKELPSTAAGPARFKLGWLWFWVGLMSPPLLTMASAFLMRTLSPNAFNENLSPAIALIGGGLGGLLGGIVLGTRIGKSRGARIGYSILLAIPMVFVTVMLCFFGCNLGGYHLDLH